MPRFFYILLFLSLPTLVLGREYLDLNGDKFNGPWEKTGGVMSAACIYRSTDQHGDSITLSGRIYVPQEGRAERIILCPHYTITNQKDCPPEGHPHEACLATEKHVLVLPDYLGYGITVNHVHPYLNVPLTTQNTIDMLLAVQRFLIRCDMRPVSDSIIIVGYSQGAAVAIGSLMQIEQNDICPVKKCYASSGPYDVAVTYDLSVERDHIGWAFVIPHFQLGTAAAYDIEVSLDTVFTPWMRKHCDYAMHKQHGLIANALYYGKGRFSKYLSVAGMDKTKGQQRILYQGYVKNSIVHIYKGDTIMSDWSPRTPIYLMHSVDDNLVDFTCSQNLRTMFERNGATSIEYEFGHYGGHIRSLFRFFRLMQKEMKKD